MMFGPSSFIVVSFLILGIGKEAYGYKYCKRGTFQCRVSLPQKIRRSLCIDERNRETQIARRYYTLTIPKGVDEENPNQEPLYPILNQTVQTIGLYASFNDGKWFSTAQSSKLIVTKTVTKIFPNYENKTIDNYGEYRRLYELFLNVATKAFPAQTLSQPVHLSGFTDIVTDDKWKNDKYFVQRRLAGQCSHFLRLVNDKPGKNVGMNTQKLISLLNKKFDWCDYLEKNYGAPFRKLVAEKRLFVLYHELYGKIPQSPDFTDIDPNDDIKLRNKSSPIAIFVLNKKRELEIAAIQTNDGNDAPVVTPKDTEYAWLQAKGSVEVVEMTMCQLVGHLLETHLTTDLFCNLFQRHLGRLHPLYQILFKHCEGTTTIGAVGLPLLLNPGAFADRLFSVGYLGSRKIVNEAYKVHNYDNADFYLQLKKQGLNDPSLIRYHPYRDDGKVIWNEIKLFSRRYVRLYYKTDRDVYRDTELQSFVNELSADGTSENGGKYVGFPARFTKRSDVVTCIARFLWTIVQHAIDSYPLIPYGSYVPIAPSKLYENPEGQQKKDYVYHLPNGKTSFYQEDLIFKLVTLRLNRLFDYSNALEDAKARRLVRMTYVKLNTCIQKKLEMRNAKRFKNKDLTYQFIEPKWLSNSIHV